MFKELSKFYGEFNNSKILKSWWPGESEYEIMIGSILTQNTNWNNVEKAIPRDIELYDYYHGLIVEHAKRFCKKRPTCEICNLNKLCKKNGL
ncbi:MAG: hypothetical protein CR982_02930 [Candidatus Cloacimonadota bacterium]|nr:MAG: hypothetical protein CR982_02930 [Candidatus Cloacimonadota bacterium]PIE79225.1 MAG: hypothetical protein CSA15_04125 [Candidatus Delongbacteria bacterium]